MLPIAPPSPLAPRPSPRHMCLCASLDAPASTQPCSPGTYNLETEPVCLIPRYAPLKEIKL